MASVHLARPDFRWADVMVPCIQLKSKPGQEIYRDRGHKKVGMKSDTQESEISFQNKSGAEINSLKKLIPRSLDPNDHLNLLNIKMCNKKSVTWSRRV